VRVVIAPDGFGGSLTASEAADAIATGWRRHRPDDELVTVPLSDGGEGLLDVVAGPRDTWVTVEVAGPQGHPVDAAFLLREDGSAIVESARACGLHLVPEDRRTPRLATTYGVGQLLDAAREHGARRILLGLGGSATVDGGAGALTGLGFRLTVADGSGLKIGAEDLGRVAGAAPGWAADWSGTEVVLLADVRTRLLDAGRLFGPQKGATEEELPMLTAALGAWAEVAERDLAGVTHRDEDGTGAAGGLGFGLRCALPRTSLAVGVDVVAELVGLDEQLRGADLVVTGEGRLDATSTGTKVVPAVVTRARAAGVDIAAVVGAVRAPTPAELVDLEVVAASPDGPGPDPGAQVADAAARLARNRTSRGAP
jgi:glycerate 2-kinase